MIYIFIIIDLILFWFFGIIVGSIGIAITILYVYLFATGIFGRIEFFKSTFFEGIAFLKDYNCPYSKLGQAFNEALQIINEMKLKEKGKEYSIIGIYYDKPGKSDTMRCSIGIYQKNSISQEKPQKELEELCISKGYNYCELPNQSSLFCSWKYSNKLSMFYGIYKFNKELKENLNNPEFKKNFKLNDKGFNYVIEVYENDSNIKFYVPLIDEEKFFFYKKDK